MDFLVKGGYEALWNILSSVMDVDELLKAGKESGWAEWAAKQPTVATSKRGRPQFRNPKTGDLITKPLNLPAPKAPRERAVAEKELPKTLKLQPGKVLEREWEGKRIAFEVMPQGGFRYQGDPITVKFRGEDKEFRPGGIRLESIEFFIKQLTDGAQGWKQFFDVKKETAKEAKLKAAGAGGGKSSPYEGIAVGDVLSGTHGGKRIEVERTPDGFRWTGDTVIILRKDKEAKIQYGQKLTGGALSDIIGQLTQGSTSWQEFFGKPGAKKKAAPKIGATKDVPEIKATTAGAVSALKQQVKETTQAKPEKPHEDKTVKITALTPAQQNAYIKTAREGLESSARMYRDDDSDIAVSMYRLHPVKDIWGVVMHRGDTLSQFGRHEGKAAAIKFALEHLADAKSEALERKLEPFSAKEHEAGLKQLNEWQKTAQRVEHDLQRRKEAEEAGVPVEKPRAKGTDWINEIKHLLLGKRDWDVVSPAEHLGAGATDYTVAHPLLTAPQGRMYVTKLPSGKFKASVHIRPYDPATSGYDKQAEPIRISEEFDKLDDDKSRATMRDWFKLMMREAEKRRSEESGRYPEQSQMMYHINQEEAVVRRRIKDSPIGPYRSSQLNEAVDEHMKEARQAIRDLWAGKKTTKATSAVLHTALSKLKKAESQ